MAHEFKKLGDVEIAEAISESANVLIEEEGNIKRVSKNNVVPNNVALKSDIPENIALKSDIPDAVINPSNAVVGQTIVVKAVDENGKPTEWECADKGEQPDWNNNDNSSMSYIKNRPFYEENGYIVNIPEQTVTCEVSGQNARASLTFNEYIPWDAICRVTFDGVVYDNIAAWESGGDMCVYVNFNTVNGDAISICESNSISVPSSLAGEHTIKVEQKTVITHTIENKYLGIPVYAGEGENAVCINQPFTGLDRASGELSCAEGVGIASGFASHAEGDGHASGSYSHAEGNATKASSSNSHAEGYNTTASGSNSHAEGYSTTASGSNSHAEGYYTIAAGDYSHAQGKYNIEDTENKYAHIVGNGSGTTRSNAHTLDWDGNAWYQGTVEGTAFIVTSSTSGSTKRFKITVDDSGTISAAEVTE